MVVNIPGFNVTDGEVNSEFKSILINVIIKIEKLAFRLANYTVIQTSTELN